MMQEEERSEERRDSSRTLRTVVLVAIAIVAVVFVIKNDQSVDIDYIFGTVDIPLVWGLLATLLLGFVAGWLLRSFRRGRD